MEKSWILFSCKVCRNPDSDNVVFLSRIGSVADLDLVLRTKKVNDDVLVVSKLGFSLVLLFKKINIIEL